jgi:hypothetical protein
VDGGRAQRGEILPRAQVTRRIVLVTLVLKRLPVGERRDLLCQELVSESPVRVSWGVLLIVVALS